MKRLTFFLLIFMTSVALGKNSKSYDPSGYVASKEARRTQTNVLDSTSSKKAAIIDCAPTPANPDDDSRPPIEFIEVKESDGETTAERGNLPAGQDLAKAVIKAARENCRRSAPASGTSVNVSVSRPESDASAPAGVDSLSTMRPTVGFTKSF